MVFKNHRFLTWRSLFGDFFHSEFLGLQKSSISESYQSLMTLKSRKTTIHLHFQKWSLLAFSDKIGKSRR